MLTLEPGISPCANGSYSCRLSNNIQVESHKSYISEYDVKRFTMIKIQKQSQSVRFSSIPEASK